MTKVSGPDALTLPASLAREIKAAADEDDRQPTELVCEVVQRYLSDRRWRQLVAYGEARARELGLTEADLPQLIAEARRVPGREP